MWLTKKPKKLNLALQGGGAHGAFTWGVLDRLLDDGGLEFAAVSATSAGAFNAVALAHGLVTGGRVSARAALRAIWMEVERARVPDLLRLNPLLSSFASAVGVVSPYSFNPLGFDLLRKILEAHVDFEAIRNSRAVELRLAATDVATGRARIFTGSEITVDAVLASACLPQLHHAVMIDGRAYWDGGFSANPDLLTMIAACRARDTLLVLLNPIETSDVPRSALAIEGRVNTITFNQPLLRDIEAIVRAQATPTGWFAPRGGELARLQAHRFHLIDAGEHTASLGADTKVMPDREVLQKLYLAGCDEAELWLAANRAAIGRRSTVDLAKRFLAPLEMPPERQPASTNGSAGPIAIARSA